MKDKRGVNRGKCRKCTACPNFVSTPSVEESDQTQDRELDLEDRDEEKLCCDEDGPSDSPPVKSKKIKTSRGSGGSMLCYRCGHTPGDHLNLDRPAVTVPAPSLSSTSSASIMSSVTASPSSSASRANHQQQQTQAWSDRVPFGSACFRGQRSRDVPVAMDVDQGGQGLRSVAVNCSYPGCTRSVSFDPNTGEQGSLCMEHQYALNAASANPHLMPPPSLSSSTSLLLPSASSFQVEDIEDGEVEAMDQVLTPLRAAHQQQQFQQQFHLHQQQQLPTHVYSQAQHTFQQPKQQMTPGPTVPAVHHTAGPPIQLANSITGASTRSKCAIAECPNSCFVDAQGKTHECCGYTHAMELQRRKALQQQVTHGGIQVVKGVSHCLLPECNNPCWPFENYCGKKHATAGKQRGLVPPAANVPASSASSAKSDPSLCIIPNCTRPKFVEPGGVLHPYCGKTHAELGKKRGIIPSAERPEEQCELPGCTQPRFREGPRLHDYCSTNHARLDAPNRDVRLLKSLSEVDKFLAKFGSSLTVVSRDENPEAKPGGRLFERFRARASAQPKGERKTCLAFHGTAESNIDSICKNGYDPKLRSGQAHGPGEYFATTPDLSKQYCQGKKMLLNELLLGKSGVDHTQHGNIIVMKNPDHDLPRFVITFK